MQLLGINLAVAQDTKSIHTGLQILTLCQSLWHLNDTRQVPFDISVTNTGFDVL